MRIGLIGANGRMGRAIVALRREDDQVRAIGRDADRAGIEPGSLDGLIDFSVPAALPATLSLARRLRVPLLVGTTGLGAGDFTEIDAAARDIALLQTGNTSLGINLLQRLVGEAAARLGPDWDVEIVEMHHRAKRDAPSGTALMLGAAATVARGAAAGALDRLDRMTAGPAVREPGTIHYASLRGGTVAGEHKVILAGDGERIELAHIADDREVFARGALRAARWLIGRPPGRYAMTDLFSARP